MCTSSAEEKDSMSRTNSLYSTFAWDPGRFPQLPAIDSSVLSGQYLVGGHVPCIKYKYNSLSPYGTQSLVGKHDNKDWNSLWRAGEKKYLASTMGKSYRKRDIGGKIFSLCNLWKSREVGKSRASPIQFPYWSIKKRWTPNQQIKTNQKTQRLRLQGWWCTHSWDLKTLGYTLASSSANRQSSSQWSGQSENIFKCKQITKDPTSSFW